MNKDHGARVMRELSQVNGMMLNVQRKILICKKYVTSFCYILKIYLWVTTFRKNVRYVECKVTFYLINAPWKSMTHVCDHPLFILHCLLFYEELDKQDPLWLLNKAVLIHPHANSIICSHSYPMAFQRSGGKLQLLSNIVPIVISTELFSSPVKLSSTGS